MFAKRHNGKFVLRIEDTDQKRIVPGSAENLEHMLSWAGLPPDETPLLGGPYGPYVQSQRIQKYKDSAHLLLESGLAYKCFCSEARLEVLRKEAMQARENPRYDNKCRHLTQSEIDALLGKNKPFTIRFKLEQGPMIFDDLVHGPSRFDVSEYEGDFIVLKSDGFPTYHFACVVDDHLMNISHVLRGAEWLPSTTKHIMLHKAFKWTPPKFAHLPLLVNSDGSKLSKRQDAIRVEHFKSQGYSPEALLNFLASAGGGFGRKVGINLVDVEELYSAFDISEVRTNPCVLDMEKLTVFNHHYFIKQLSNENKAAALVKDFRVLLKQTYGERFEGNEKMTDTYIRRILNCYKGRVDFMTELLKPEMAFLWTSPEKGAVLSKLKNINPHQSEIATTLGKVKCLLQQISKTDFVQDKLSTVLKKFSSEQGLKYKTFMIMLRIALTGQMEGPGIGEMLHMLGQERSCEKLSAAIDIVEAKM